MKVPELMRLREENLQNNTDHQLLQAIQVHYDIVTIHPFVDGNGRTARLMMNAILLIS